MSLRDRLTVTLREAGRADIAEMHRVRMSVEENRLVSTVLTPTRYLEYIESRGRGWVVELDGALLAFAVGDNQDASLWALFVEPAHEGKGYGRRLHDTAVSWLFDQGHKRIWLSTAPGTRTERFYRKAGWLQSGYTAEGEARFELPNPRTTLTG